MPSARVTAGVVLAGFCVFLQFYATQPLLTMLRQEFGASAAGVSLTVSAGTIAVALASPLMGLAADALGRKRVIVPCLLAVTAATFLCATARDLHTLIVYRFISGLFTPGVIATALAYITEETPKGRAGAVTGAYVSGTVLGGLVGRTGCAFVADRWGWHASFVFLGATTLAGTLATLLLLPRSTRFRRRSDLLAPLRAMLEHMRNPGILATCFVGFGSLFCHVGLFTYANLYLGEPPFSLSTSALGSIFLVYALGLVITPSAGKLVDRFGHRFGALIAVATIVAGALLTLLPALSAVILGLAVCSSGVFIAQAAASSHIGHVASHSRSAASGVYVACYYLGGSVGATALAVPWETWHWPGVVISLLLAQGVASVVVYRCFATRRQMEPAEKAAPPFDPGS